jgi:transposase InsO family protein
MDPNVVPSRSTITEILRRHGVLTAERDGARGRWQRYEREAPNDLWQMDFKGHFALQQGGRCHPLTVIDDHSRFALCIGACGDERYSTVQP